MSIQDIKQKAEEFSLALRKCPPNMSVSVIDLANCYDLIAKLAGETSRKTDR